MQIKTYQHQQKTLLEHRMKNLQKLAKQSLYGKDNLYKDNAGGYKV